MICVVCLAVIIALAVIPVPHSYRFIIFATSPTEEGSQFQTFPEGAGVSGSWTASSSQSVSLTIACGLGQVYAGSGTSGSFSFTAQLFACLFTVTSTEPVNVTVTGTYSSPLL